MTCKWISYEDFRNQKCTDIDDYVQIYAYRCNKLLQETVSNLSKRKGNKFDAWNSEQVFAAQKLGIAFAEYICVLLDYRFISQLKDLKPDSIEIFTLLYKLSALCKIERDIGAWYEHGYLSASQGANIRS
jgi:hypothetical protein